MINETDSTIDSELLAHIDGALSPSDRAALDTRLAGDPALRARLSELAAGSRPFAGAYEVLLRDAPHERLRAAMDRARTELEARQAQRPRPAVRRWLQPLAAAVALFVAGGLVGLGVTHFVIDTPIAGEESAGNDGGWRATVAEYLTLYTRDTLANLPNDPGLREAELKSVGDKLALPLSVDKVTLDGLLLKRSQLYNLDGRPLAQIAYLTENDEPVAFCIIADDEGDRTPSFEERQGKNIVYWSKGGHAFMLIGNLPRTTLEPLAASLAARLA